jgi:hypothetical protein
VAALAEAGRAVAALAAAGRAVTALAGRPVAGRARLAVVGLNGCGLGWLGSLGWLGWLGLLGLLGWLGLGWTSRAAAGPSAAA